MPNLRTPKRRITVLFDGRGGEEEPARQVVRVLVAKGFDTAALGVDDDLESMAKSLRNRRPELVLNLVERFAKDAQLRPDVAAALELLGMPYTGAGLAGLYLASDAPLTARVLASHGLELAPTGDDEVTVGVLGNDTAQLFPEGPHGPIVRAAQHALRLRDYALITIRGAAVVRAVANPSLGPQDELARLALAASISYESLLEQIVDEAFARLQAPVNLEHADM